MKLTVDQLFEVSIALRGGLSDANWAALSPEERSSLIASHQARLQERLADPRIPEAERAALRESAELIGRPEEEDRWHRDHYYGQPPAKRARSLAGYQQAVNDLLSLAHHFSVSQRAAIDVRLATQTLPTLRQLEIGLKRKHAKILKRGKIRDKEEYYIVKEILCDTSFDVTAAERTALEEMAGSFEGAQ